jgi:hypothetical protein
MCQNEFDKDALDFLGRCEECFRKYLTMDAKPNLGVPWSKVTKNAWQRDGI